ncbi:MAG: hypothetical protein B9S32_04145 [Verrucomicrobia bacterium Tous-C9LFEB]|nr:MAG: hypothetical protein B9S32_04145 [Verrucomicrobia bacterium Tous-C9LFEB]
MYKNQKCLSDVTPAHRGWSTKGFLFGAVLMATCLPLVAQNSETTTTTTTKAVAVPVVQTPVSTTESVTTKTSVQTRTLYLRASYHGQVKNGNQVFIRPSGRIYDVDAVYIGHLTDLNGDDVSMIPSDRRYKIRNVNGTIIASTKLTSLYDNDRTITLARQDANGHLISETTETISTTTVPAVVVVPVVPAQSSTTTTTTQSAPARLTIP